MPMDDLCRCRMVRHINRDGLSFFEAQEWTRNLLIVGEGPDGMLRRNLKRIGRDVERVVGLGSAEGSCRHSSRNRRSSAQLKNLSPRKHPVLMLAAKGEQTVTEMTAGASSH